MSTSGRVVTGSAGLPGTGQAGETVTLAQIVAALSVTYKPYGVLIWLSGMADNGAGGVNDLDTLAEKVRRIDGVDPSDFTITDSRAAALSTTRRLLPRGRIGGTRASAVGSAVTAHDHAVYVPGCFRCDLSRDETAAGSVEAMQWHGGEHVRERTEGHSASEIVLWVIANGGEARYEPEHMNRAEYGKSVVLRVTARIAVRTREGWAHCASGQWVVKGEKFLLDEGPADYDLPIRPGAIRQICEFTVEDR